MLSDMECGGLNLRERADAPLTVQLDLISLPSIRMRF